MHVLATAGHVDHGKSTLVRALTGMEPDRWAEERRRGMTIDLGFAWTTLPTLTPQTVAFVDVPGHERFVTTMLAGVGPVPAVLLAVAADEGWMPQSAEHVEALNALGVRHGLLVITRSDLFAPDPAREEAQRHLAATSLGELPAVCVSATTGAGMDELRAAIAKLVAVLPAPDPGADVRLWVDRAFTIRGAGTVVTGTLAAGTIRVGDELQLAGDGRRVAVRGLQSLGEPQQEVAAVARVAVNLRGVPREAVARGDALVTPDRWLTTALVDARLHDPQHGPQHGQRLPSELTLHIGAAAVPARVRPLSGGHVRLLLALPQPLRIGDRALLRDPGRRQITAGITVLDVQPPPLRRRGAAAARAGVLATMDGVPDAAAELARRGLVRVADLVAMGADPAAALAQDDAGADRQPAAALFRDTAGWLLDPAVAAALAARLATAVAEHDAADPLEPGLSVQAARRLLDLPDARLLATLLDEPAAACLVQRDGRIRAAKTPGSGGDDALPAAVRTALETLRTDLRQEPFAAPDTGRLTELGLGSKELAALVRGGHLERIGDGVYLLPGAAERATQVLTQLAPEFTLSEARQALGTTRRVAVPLLELLSRTGHTRRTAEGNHRLRASGQR